MDPYQRDHSMIMMLLLDLDGSSPRYGVKKDGSAAYSVDNFRVNVKSVGDEGLTLTMTSPYLPDKSLTLPGHTLTEDQSFILRGFYQMHKMREADRMGLSS